jgi:hypothetical protein
MAPLRRFTPPAASRAIGNYRCEFPFQAPAQPAKTHSKPSAKAERQSPSQSPALTDIKLDALRRGLAVPVQRHQIIRTRLD